MIPGGYILKSRKIKDSPVHKMPPYVREIWDYCLREANYHDATYGIHTIKRGQLFRSYKDIRDDLCWYIGYRKMMYNENHTKKAMKALREACMIETSKELGGVLITVLKYDHYQDPKNYERTTDGTSERTTKEPSKNHPIPDNNKKNKNVKKEKNNPLTNKEDFIKNIPDSVYKKGHSKEQVLNTIDDLIDYCKAHKKKGNYDDYYAALRNFLKKVTPTNGIKSDKLSFEKYKEAFKLKKDTPDKKFNSDQLNKIVKQYPYIIEYELDSKKFELTYKDYLKI